VHTEDEGDAALSLEEGQAQGAATGVLTSVDGPGATAAHTGMWRGVEARPPDSAAAPARAAL
jgi:hypothetical protein